MLTPTDTWVLFAVVLVALVFDFTNGFHDAANAIATSIGTRALTPTVALAMAAVLNVVGGLVFETHVAATLSKIVTHEVASQELVLASLLGAIIWNLFTQIYGIPSSSSHALIGGPVGAALTASWRLDQVHWAMIWRIVGFERRLTVAFTVDEDTVTVLRLFTAGRDWDSL